jgi:hypothetical protein
MQTQNSNGENRKSLLVPAAQKKFLNLLPLRRRVSVQKKVNRGAIKMARDAAG